MRGRGPLVVPLLLIVGGLLLLKGLDGQDRASPVVSPENGGPRGLLALASWAKTTLGHEVMVHRDDAPLSAGAGDLVIIPPPEARRLRQATVEALAAAAEAGAHVVVLCDEEKPRNGRFVLLYPVVGMQCEGGEGLPATAHSRVQSPDTLGFAVRSKLKLKRDVAWAVPYVFDDEDGALATRSHGAGRFTALSNASVVQNDGLSREGNAALVRGWLNDHPRLIIDASHHRLQQSAAAAEAFGRTGPLTGFLTMLLLLAAAGLMLFPRAGDVVHQAQADGPPPASDIHALAALYRQAGLDEDASVEDTP